MKHMSKVIIGILFIIAIVAGYYYFRHPLGVKVAIDNHVFYVEVAATDAQKELGLGDRNSMQLDHGMLFPYQIPNTYKFWMKGMRFPLDMIWIKNKTIIDITKNVPVATTTIIPTYSPISPVDMVLELNAGTVDLDGIKIGDRVDIQL